MTKNIHELRDPIHAFVRLTTDERKVLDSKPFQRLRHIHQLALTYLVYPGATHRRFEHSLGVMELAGRVYDIVTRRENLEYLPREAFSLLSDLSDNMKLEYWRRVLRMAALCHDLGHLPFSHAAERRLLPEGRTHENLTALLVRSPEMASIWSDMKINSEDVVKLALGPKDLPTVSFSALETILSEIVVGDAFGVDRIDYLLRDSLHLGVAYGRFDHFRLIDTLRILPSPPQSEQDEADSDDEIELALGVEEGGMQSAEALLLARYFMFSQVYFHPIRRIYDIHLSDFLTAWWGKNGYPFTTQEHLSLTDSEVMVMMRKAQNDPGAAGHEDARRILERMHFKLIYSRNPADTALNPEAGDQVYVTLRREFGAESFRHDRYTQKAGLPNFPVLLRDDSTTSSLAISETLQRLPVVSVDSVYADPGVRDKAKRWLDKNRGSILQPATEERHDESAI